MNEFIPYFTATPLTVGFLYMSYPSSPHHYIYTEYSSTAQNISVNSFIRRGHQSYSQVPPSPSLHRVGRRKDTENEVERILQCCCNSLCTKLQRVTIQRKTLWHYFCLVLAVFYYYAYYLGQYFYGARISISQRQNAGNEANGKIWLETDFLRGNVARWTVSCDM